MSPPARPASRPSPVCASCPHGWLGRRNEYRFAEVEEGAPISYQVLDTGVPVYSLEGEHLGTVDHVVAAVAQDIFHGLVMRSPGGRRFIAADQVASLHERGGDPRVDAAAAPRVPQPHRSPPGPPRPETGAK